MSIGGRDSKNDLRKGEKYNSKCTKLQSDIVFRVYVQVGWKKGIRGHETGGLLKENSTHYAAHTWQKNNTQKTLPVRSSLEWTIPVDIPCQHRVAT